MKEQYDQLVSKSFRAFGKSKVSLLEEAMRIADQYLDHKERYSIRMKLIYAAADAGMGEKVIPAFTWCLNEFDRHPDQYYTSEFFRQYQTMINQMMAYPHISLQKIEESMQNLRQRLQLYNRSLRPYYRLKMNFAKQISDIQSLERYYHLWLAEPEDRCQACELHTQTSTLIYLKRYEEAYQAAKPLLDYQLFHYYVPRITYSFFLLPLLQQNKKKEAAKLHRKGFLWVNSEWIKNFAPYIVAASRHLEYLTVVHRKQAIQLIERYLPAVLETPNPLKKFYFYRSATIFFPYRKKFDIELPEGVTMASIENELNQLAEAFDRRNGTNAFRESIHERTIEIAQRKKQYSHS